MSFEPAIQWEPHRPHDSNPENYRAVGSPWTEPTRKRTQFTENAEERRGRVPNAKQANAELQELKKSETLKDHLKALRESHVERQP